ncbi:MAG: hypothetical protein V4773_24320 [Verrucomicrobiota bacterium]
MAEENENNAGKKRRVIHWDPNAGREQEGKRWTWTRMLLWGVGGFIGLLVVAGIVIRGIKFIAGPDVFTRKPAVEAGAPNLAQANSAFINQAKAAQLHDMATKSLNELRKMPTDHPTQLEHLILMQKAYNEAETVLHDREWGRAYGMFENLNKEIAAYSTNVKLKGEARKGYDAILLKIKDLEMARSLAPGALEAAFESAGAGRQLLTDGNFTGAKNTFDRGFLELKKAEEALGDYVRENLLAGQKNLSMGEKEAARKSFQAAMEKSPGNEVAVAGLKRAENIDRVYALLQQGAKLEADKQYAQAAESYQKAFALDAFSAAAQEGQARAARLEKETKFAAAKNAADAAFQAKDWGKAISEFESALKVYPKKPDVTASLKSARESAHKEAVQKALTKAFDYEKNYQWKEAREAFNEVVQLQPDQAEAKEGYTRVGTIIRALLNYERYVEAAEQLANKADFQGAIKRFNEAMAVKPSYLVNSERVNQLHNTLMAQNKPVEVTFNSDGNTWVVISSFRQPEKFASKVIKILPGDYEVIGRRSGYNDVQMLLQVRNGTPPPVVTVACTVQRGRP